MARYKFYTVLYFIVLPLIATEIIELYKIDFVYILRWPDGGATWKYSSPPLKIQLVGITLINQIKQKSYKYSVRRSDNEYEHHYLLCVRWLRTRSPVVRADINDNSAAITVAHTTRANVWAFTPGVSAFEPTTPSICNSKQRYYSIMTAFWRITILAIFPDKFHGHYATSLKYVISLICWSPARARFLNHIYLTSTTLYCSKIPIWLIKIKGGHNKRT